MTKLQLQQAFQDDYTKAVEYYQDGNLRDFFKRIRTAIELFGKLVLADVLDDEPTYNNIIKGLKSFETAEVEGEKRTVISDSHLSRTPEGAHFVVLAKSAIFYKFPEIALPQYTKTRSLKAHIENFEKGMKSSYCSASELAGHTDETKKDIFVHANACIGDFQKCFDVLKDVLNPEIATFLKSLPKLQEFDPLIYEDKGQMAETTTNDFTVLDEITNNFSQMPGTEYVAFLPEQIIDRFGHPLGSTQMQDFFRLQWSLVVDSDKKTTNGLYEQAPSQKKSAIRIITDNLSEVTGSSNLTNWIFAKGRIDLGGLDDKRTLRQAPQLFSRTFSKIAKTGLTTDYIIFDFCDNFSRLTIRFFDKLEDVFDSWDNVKNRCKIVSFSQHVEYKEKLQEWAESLDMDIVFVSAGFADFIHHISQIKPLPEYKSDKFLIRGNSLDIAEAKERYRAAGIDFFGPSAQPNVERKWDFYSGAEITWEELEQQCDVQREQYIVVRRRIDTIIRTMRRTKIYTLRHRPGSGATTIARRLAHDFKKEDEMGTISCTVIDIKNCSNIRITEQYLSLLSESVENTPILAIVEAKRVGREKFDYLVKRVSDAGKKVLFFYVEPFTGKYTSKEDVILLDSVLKPVERERFSQKYRQLGLTSETLNALAKGRQHLEVVDFPLMLRDNETSDNIGSYVSEWLEVLPDNLKKFCAYVAFVFKYSDLGVNQILLKSIWKDVTHFSMSSYGEDIFNAMRKLLIEETTGDGKFTGIWRPRYNSFSKFILQAYKTNWKDSLSEMAKGFISLCQGAGELGSDDKDMLYSVFIIRKNADYRAIEDRTRNLKSKFSLLVKDLDDIERAESLFAALVKAFPEDAVFRGHYARFLYEKASMSKGITIEDRLFSDAQEQLQIAFGLNPDDSDLYHMQGMLLRRKLQTLFNSIKNLTIEEVNQDEIQDCIEEWTQGAVNAFERSIKLNPASPYGYAAESQLYMESIKFGKWLLGKEDYTFCETSPIYSEYSEKLGDVLDMFEQICYAFKNEGLSQIMSSYPIYENVRAFHRSIIGQNVESINRYRVLYGKATGEKKLLYGNMLVKSIIYSKSSKNDTRTAYSYLTQQERREIEVILEHQKNKGDIKSYETLFMLKLYGTEEFELDEAIDMLKEWERQYTEGAQFGWGYLNACFYLAVCYCAKSILSGIKNVELSSLSMLYFKKSEDLAKQFDKGTIMPQCYLGERHDIHCIVDKNRKDFDACTVTGIIHSIKNNRGILRMRCGVDVSFKANGFDILRDEGQTLRGVLGFSYSGPGLYDFRPESADNDDILIDEQDEPEITYEQLQKEYVPIADIDDIEKEDTTEVEIDNEVKMPFRLKVLGKIELSEQDKTRAVLHRDTTITDKVDGNTNTNVKVQSNIHGNINSNRNKVFVPSLRRSFIIDRIRGFSQNYSPRDYDYAENEEVIFETKETINPSTGEPFFFAINVKPALEE